MLVVGGIRHGDNIIHKDHYVALCRIISFAPVDVDRTSVMCEIQNYEVRYFIANRGGPINRVLVACGMSDEEATSLLWSLC
jgi:hypothetical protein